MSITPNRDSGARTFASRIARGRRPAGNQPSPPGNSAISARGFFHPRARPLLQTMNHRLTRPPPPSLLNHRRVFYDKRIAAEIPGEALGDEYKGYIFKVMGGNDKQGFGMKQGVLTAQRVFLLMSPKTQGMRGHGRRKGERRRKAVRGCIISPAITVLNLIIVKQGDAPLPGITDEEKPRMRGPKRASKIRKLFALTKDDDVRKYVNTYRREFESATGKKKSKAPKIQRLITADRLRRRKTEKNEHAAKIAKSKAEAAEYQKLLAHRLKEARERRSESLAKRRASSVAKKEAK